MFYGNNDEDMVLGLEWAEWKGLSPSYMTWSLPEYQIRLYKKSLRLHETNNKWSINNSQSYGTE